MSTSRREFIAAAGALCACAVCPDVFGAPAISGTVDAGVATDIADGAILPNFAGKDGFFVVHKGDKLYAMSSNCTHKGAIVKFVDNNQVFCPKHKSKFDATGAVVGGPAKKSLPRLAISIDDKGHVIVDPSKTFTDDKWNDPAASVKAPAKKTA